MIWRKLGRIFQVDGSVPWMRTHAALPCGRRLGTHLYRVYFSSRNEFQQSHVGWFDLDLRRPLNILGISDSPVLKPGRAGQFDDSGATLAWIQERGDKAFFYYVGWNRGTRVPFRNALGLAILNQAGEIEKPFSGPLLDRGIHDPCFVASGCVYDTGAGLHLWYLSCIDWEPAAGGLRHRYHIKHAASDDGIHWRREGKVCIDFQNADEYAISRPSVVKDADRYRMWYSYRGDTYRIGYAESRDGLNWTRMDYRAGIDVSAEGWDSEMIEYPHVFDCEGKRYMLYNGNGYGETGIGLALLEQD